MNEQELIGFLLINKPTKITSFGCVKKIKKLLPRKTKVGHAGTLDDFASGMLIIGINRKATKLIDSLMNLDKTYKVKGKLGELRDSLDFTGEVLKEIDSSNITKEDIQKAIDSLKPEYTQIPPIYSALKHKGKSLYKYVRNQLISSEELEKIVEKKKRVIKIYQANLLSFEPPFFDVEAHVSKGTYIRSLVNDIAQKSNNYATTYELERTAIGSLKIKEAVDLETINTIEDIEKYLITPESIQNKLTEENK